MERLGLSSRTHAELAVGCFSTPSAAPETQRVARSPPHSALRILRSTFNARRKLKEKGRDAFLFVRS